MAGRSKPIIILLIIILIIIIIIIIDQYLSNMKFQKCNFVVIIIHHKNHSFLLSTILILTVHTKYSTYQAVINTIYNQYSSDHSSSSSSPREQSSILIPLLISTHQTPLSHLGIYRYPYSYLGSVQKKQSQNKVKTFRKQMKLALYSYE